MTKKELKKLSRMELLEMLIEQSRHVEELQTQLEAAEQKLNETTQQLEETSRKLDVANEKLIDRAIAQERAGSIAEAALQLSGIFEAAQQAADLYLENIRKIGTAEQSEQMPGETAGQTEKVAE